MGRLKNISPADDVTFYVRGTPIASTCLVSIVPLFKSRSLSTQTEVVQLLKRSEYDKETVVGDTPLYGLYRYVRPQRVGTFSRFGLK